MGTSNGSAKSYHQAVHKDDSPVTLESKNTNIIGSPFTSPTVAGQSGNGKGAFGNNDTGRQLVCQIFAGCGAGVMTSLATCPLDVVKIRLQSQLPFTPDLVPNIPSHINGSSVRYKGTFPSLKRIWREEGIRGLYRGLGPSLIGYLPTFGFYFPTYYFCKEYLSTHIDAWDRNQVQVHMISAVIAGGAGSVITNPLWVIRTRMVTQPNIVPRIYPTSWDATKLIFRLEGWRGFYKGLGPSLLGVLHVVVQFPIYERLKLLVKSEEQTELKASQIFFASTLAKMTASTVTYPHEVLRTRLQNQRTTGSTLPKYRTIRQSISLIWQEEGLRGFYRGLPTNLFRVVPASAVTFVTYELLLQHLTLYI